MRLVLVARPGKVFAGFLPSTPNDGEYPVTSDLWETLLLLLFAEMDACYSDRVRRKNPCITNTDEWPETEITAMFARADECLSAVYQKLQEKGLISEWPRKPEYGWVLNSISAKEATIAVEAWVSE